ncbi:DUF4871 domain-containing protein [Alkalihalobacillus sp. AL-G]|uniref:DUF4871 domain-containing protein n=1 Tax=Alkalihalobacillus sp. AL-G TaxID=2926399 RepID=UPI00272C1A64|nr:DUF4871 domain-containing protein [Alkalihalobacillus sp. AL-G]WLD94638.1 DUF4871 domain-containing protein [Alkalihalobacillus sp. AL-G]
MKKYLPLLTVLLAILIGCQNETVKDENWEPSSTFKTTENREMIGMENRIGVICTTELKSNSPAKCMWHFWDDTLQTSKEYTVRVEGIMEENNKKFPVLTPLDGEPTYTQKLGLMGSNNGAPFHLPSRLLFPHSGVWKVSIYFNDDYFDSIILDVK